MENDSSGTSNEAEGGGDRRGAEIMMVRAEKAGERRRK